MAHLYSVPQENVDWWDSFVYVFFFVVPFYLISSVFRGVLQARKKFKKLTVLDATIEFVFYIPIAYASLVSENPILFYCGFLGTELIFLLCVFVYLKNRNLLLEGQ